MKPLRIGTRGSRLALAQAEWVARRLSHLSSGRDFELVTIETSGDRLSVPTLGDGVFVKEIQRALLDGEVDAAVHSLKDVPTEPTPGLVAAAVPEREDPREALVGSTLGGLQNGARVGTGSPRRSAQLMRLRPDLEVVPIKGNVPTRINKVEAGECDAVMLALAGLRRLKIEPTEILSFDQVLPAPGQGALLVEVREGDTDAIDSFGRLHDKSTRECVVAERVVLRELGGGCLLPVATYARIEGGILLLDASITSDDGVRHLSARAAGDISKPLAVAKKAARDLLRQGARELIG